MFCQRLPRRMHEFVIVRDAEVEHPVALELHAAGRVRAHDSELALAAIAIEYVRLECDLQQARVAVAQCALHGEPRVDHATDDRRQTAENGRTLTRYFSMGTSISEPYSVHEPS